MVAYPDRWWKNVFNVQRFACRDLLKKVEMNLTLLLQQHRIQWNYAQSRKASASILGEIDTPPVMSLARRLSKDNFKIN
jgi:hypothetical protein